MSRPDPRSLAIICEDVSLSFGGESADCHPMVLDAISLTVKYGEFLVVSGPAGAGKTALLNILASRSMPSSGRAIICGREPATCSRIHLAEVRREIVYIEQEPKFLDGRSVLDHVALPLVFGGTTFGAARDRAEDALALVGLAEKWDFAASELSFTEKRCLSFAAVIAREPRLLIVDEPLIELEYGGLDTISHLERIHGGGVTVVLATSDSGIARGLGYTVVNIERGRVRKNLVSPEAGSR